MATRELVQVVLTLQVVQLVLMVMVAAFALLRFERGQK
jgi:hypothetical protein